MAYGLVRCGYGHIQPLEYQAYIRTSNWNQIDHDRYTCSSCKINKLYLITNYDPALSVKKITVGTFGDVRYAHASIIERKEDSIRKILTENNFVIDQQTNNSYIIYSSPEGYKAVFHLKEKAKTQDLYLLIPEKHEILKKVIEANKADKKAKRELAPPKPELPTSYKDFLGEELTIGDWVAYASFEYTNLLVGKIIKINEKTVSIKPRAKTKTISKTSSQITKLSKERAVLLSLEM